MHQLVSYCGGTWKSSHILRLYYGHELLVNLSHIIRIVVLTLKKQQKSAGFWAQSDEAGDITDELV